MYEKCIGMVKLLGAFFFLIYSFQGSSCSFFFFMSNYNNLFWIIFSIKA